MNIAAQYIRRLSLGALVFLAVSCGGGGGIGGTGSPATLKLALTDAPSCGFDAVNITVQKVRVHQVSTALDTDSGWSEIVLAPARRLNLLNLTNGVLEELGQTTLPTGKYTQLRLVLAPNDTAAPLANSVVPTGSTETPLTVPSGEQTGAKINVDIDVTADKVADFVLDLNACQSVVKLGGSGRYNLKPVVTATARLSDAGMRVIGYVDPALAAATTTVSAQLNGQSIKSSPPDATGKFVLYPVPAGSYDIVVASQGRATAVLTGVPVTTTAITTINTALTPIAPPPSVMRTVSGFVTTTGSNAIPDATLRALQTSTVTQVTVGSARVDGSTGSYSLALPAAAPLKAAYVAGGTVAFLPNSAAAGQYTLEAAVPGKTAQSVPADVSATNALKSFTFAP